MKVKKELKTPISYYGGKQNLLKRILPLIPAHTMYVEPFFGGGAVFWAKKPSKAEVINDVNMNVVNFYEVLKHDYFKLRKRIEATLHSRETYKKALIIYDCPWLFADEPVIRAWAFYVCTNQGFSHQINSWGYCRTGHATLSVQNKINRFEETLSNRIRYTQIEQNDAHKVIESRDAPDTFVYADPPYINSDQGHYGGYTDTHFRRDLDALAAMQGKFLLSTYPSDTLHEYIEKHSWNSLEISQPLTASNAAATKSDKRKLKTEVLTANYDLSNPQKNLTLF